MTTTLNQLRITSGELATLWTMYINNSVAIYVQKYLEAIATDDEIKDVVTTALGQTEARQKQLYQIFEREKIPIPYGYGEGDVNLSAPALFSDAFILNYLKQISNIALQSYSNAASLFTRPDLVTFMRESIIQALDLVNHAKQLMIEKKSHPFSPILTYPDEVSFVKKQSFLFGWRNRRTLTTLEVATLYANIQRNALTKALTIAFAQTAKSTEVTNYMLRGKEVTTKHIEVFASVLTENDVPVSTLWDSEVSTSTEPTFSERLMMFHAIQIIAAEVSFYGDSLSKTYRKDLVTHYDRFIAELELLLEDGMNLMISKEWFEQPPQAENREELYFAKKGT